MGLSSGLMWRREDDNMKCLIIVMATNISDRWRSLQSMLTRIVLYPTVSYEVGIMKFCWLGNGWAVDDLSKVTESEGKTKKALESRIIWS